MGALKIVRRWPVLVLDVGAGTLGIQYWLLRHNGNLERMDTWQGVGVYSLEKESLKTGPGGLECGVLFGVGSVEYWDYYNYQVTCR